MEVTLNDTTLDCVDTKVRPDPSVEEQKELAAAAARSLEGLVEKLSAGGKFAADFSMDPRATIDAAGIVLHKEYIEFLMIHDPDRFDRACDALFEVLDPDMINNLLSPSCDDPK